MEALRLLPSYDPSRAGLRTFMLNQLRGVRRYATQIAQPLRVPQRLARQSWEASEATKRFADEHGREPSLGELADRTGLSVRALRRATEWRPPATESAAEGVVGDSATAGKVGMRRDLAWQVLYDEADATSQRLLDMHERGLSNQAIAARLGVSEAAVSQRKRVLQSRFDGLLAKSL